MQSHEVSWTWSPKFLRAHFIHLIFETPLLFSLPHPPSLFRCFCFLLHPLIFLLHLLLLLFFFMCSFLCSLIQVRSRGRLIYCLRRWQFTLVSSPSKTHENVPCWAKTADFYMKSIEGTRGRETVVSRKNHVSIHGFHWNYAVSFTSRDQPCCDRSLKKEERKKKTRIHKSFR